MSDPSLHPPSQPGGPPTTTCFVPSCDHEALPSGFCATHQAELPGGWVMKMQQRPDDPAWRQRALDRLSPSDMTPTGRARRPAMTAPIVAEPVDDTIAGKQGYCYHCTTCDIFGFTRCGERKTCWCCESPDHLRTR